MRLLSFIFCLFCVSISSHAFAAEWRESYTEDDFPQLSVAELDNHENSLEWWYFDAEDKIGNKFVITISRKNQLVFKDRPSLYLEFQPVGYSEAIVELDRRDKPPHLQLRYNLKSLFHSP